MIKTPIVSEPSDDPNFVRLSRDCPDCKVTQRFSVTKAGWDAWDGGNGEFVQNAFPDLPVELREVLVSGICPSCWDKIFPKGEDDEE